MCPCGSQRSCGWGVWAVLRHADAEGSCCGKASGRTAVSAAAGRGAGQLQATLADQERYFEFSQRNDGSLARSG